MRLAAFNVENLFARARAMNGEDWQDGRRILEDFARFNALIGKPAYSAADKRRMAELLEALGLGRADDAEYVRLRRNRGDFLRRPKGGGIEILAAGRAEWNGWLELEREPVDDVAMRLTARVIADVGADVLGVVEAESRPALKDFSERILPLEGADPYAGVMLIDGNDTRGIDCGVMLRDGFRLATMRSHVDDADAQGLVFSRDCPEFHIATPSGARLVLLVNHLKSKGFGAKRDSDAKRRRQAEAIARIYAALRAAGEDNVAIVGDLNDTPPADDDHPLAPLLRGTDLKDISVLPGHDDGGRPGTYGAGTAGNKIDYILLSPALQARLRGSGIFRRGMWPGLRPPKWDTYPEIDPRQGGKPHQAASDHAAIFADVDI
ncbi:endonuclease/exonuclease/phosphatase family protein [Roseomonas sp. PWR1]|uniref:Endonuclease/exonuclease/phosphatase family protein n=1 Tax=Roseomonas nitratireducens TaxID=2820810 RepID=A0ABS4AX23_9PROT|nr:endonuclease/exonuclease/phosphatase family protein [Neoroseomonas nitratireducens]MBP0465940.1 endonuclease/exonuclease/phosphatase family protein [Neoroseomonas nitratireducens]